MKAYNLDKQTLKKMYATGMSLREIAEKFNCYPDTVYDYFVKYGIPRRKNIRTANLLIKNKKAEFLEKLNPFWIVGFVDGEGSFYFRCEKKQKRLYPQLSITQKDIVILEKIKSCFPNLKWNIGKSPSNSAYYCRISGFKNCIRLFWFFDKYAPIEKKDQYMIWKFLNEQLIKKDFSWELKEKIWMLYKTKKKYDDFIKNYMDMVGN